MKLIKVRIQNFRSIDNSGEFSISDTTCLVGKNEAGKTAILQALEAVNPLKEEKRKYNKTLDYPRQYYNDYKKRHPYLEAIVATTTWKLEELDVAAIETEFGPNCLTSEEIILVKRYEQSNNSWTVPINEKGVLEYIIGTFNLNAVEKSSLKKFQTSKELHSNLKNLENPTEKQSRLLKKLEGYRESEIILHAIDILVERIPKFLYSSHYDRMESPVSVEKMMGKKRDNLLSESDYVFLDFLEFAGTGLEELQILQQQQYENLRAKVEGASNQITDRIFEYWTQNQSLEIEFDIHSGQPEDTPPFNSGNVVEARVRNLLHRVSVPFSERSAGFIWFFSFLVRFSQVEKQHGNVVILLDEPGLTLHGKAQGDLLRYIKEKLEPKHQIIYTTHSPFMVPSDNLGAVRTVEDVVIKQESTGKFESKGTKVGDDILSKDQDTLFPLQGALGYEITQSLFVGEHTLLVEGPSDILYLQAASAALKAKNRTTLDPRWVICPSGGIDKVSAFLSLFGGNKLHVAVLTDFAKGKKGTVQRIKESELLQEGHVFTITDFCDKDEADIEDLFNPDLYVLLVNSAYELSGENTLTTEKLEEAEKSTKRQVLLAEAYFRLLPDDIPIFSHFTPSSWLIQNPNVLAQNSNGVNETLERFEKVFETFNKLLP